jgi:hypothetical protein
LHFLEVNCEQLLILNHLINAFFRTIRINFLRRYWKASPVAPFV